MLIIFFWNFFGISLASRLHACSHIEEVLCSTSVSVSHCPCGRIGGVLVCQDKDMLYQTGHFILHKYPPSHANIDLEAAAVPVEPEPRPRHLKVRRWFQSKNKQTKMRAESSTQKHDSGRNIPNVIRDFVTIGILLRWYTPRPD